MEANIELRISIPSDFQRFQKATTISPRSAFFLNFGRIKLTGKRIFTAGDEPITRGYKMQKAFEENAKIYPGHRKTARTAIYYNPSRYSVVVANKIYLTTTRDSVRVKILYYYCTR